MKNGPNRPKDPVSEAQKFGGIKDAIFKKTGYNRMRSPKIVQPENGRR